MADGAETDSRRRRAAFAFLGVFALLLVGLDVAREARSFERHRAPDRYAPLAAALPPDALDLGYVSNETTGDVAAQLLYETQYALAPRVVGENPGARYTVANVTDTGLLPAICERSHLRVVQRLEGGLAILERDAPR